MFLIKRTKSLPPGPMDALMGAPPPAIAWAKETDAQGVTAWTTLRDEALPLTLEAAELLLAIYAKRPAAGRVEMEPVEDGAVGQPPDEDPEAGGLLIACPEDDALLAALAEVERQREEIQMLRDDLDAATTSRAAPPAGSTDATRKGSGGRRGKNKRKSSATEEAPAPEKAAPEEVPDEAAQGAPATEENA